MPEVEEEILECIRVSNPGLWLSRSALHISPPTEVVEDPITDIEIAILATYLPGEAYEPKNRSSATSASGYTPCSFITVNSRYKHTVGTGGSMLITNICLYREKITYMTKWTNKTGNEY
ncbi:hypothetical protein L211DRAFT_895019 [Terfezia boudieri ATCC MYA-4762]|uniref:Uncharacterized protein n=1 Tax=Terfezia boudieri ATCC MYA-4762 TaxID=1051890 RepID=A0A3N4LQA2_9PEZI|nr:hypothetical protein L211DRAFT_895019 [Terfezia boudieri ATCC MYA-4762]